tara:strand:+ start:912 stop:1607 length:696 start_codon:yes stop_codon:yes gene_type:complete
MNDLKVQISIVGENSLIIYISQAPDERTIQKIALINRQLHEKLNKFIIDSIPSYISLLVTWDNLIIDYMNFKKKLVECLKNIAFENSPIKRDILKVPVYYSNVTGPDLENLAHQKHISTKELIEIHQNREYLVYAIGFAPGFAYLGNVDEKIAAPRKSTPRLKIPAGSVGIADQQTAIYPNSSPGGWNIIGRCPLELFKIGKDNNFRFSVADRVRFFSIDRNKYLSLGGKL